MCEQLEENIFFVDEMYQLQRQINRIKYIKEKINTNTYKQNTTPIFTQLNKRLLKTSCSSRNLKKSDEPQGMFQSKKSKKYILDEKINQRSIQNQKTFYHKKQKIDHLKKIKAQNYFLMKEQKQKIKFNKKKQFLKNLLNAKLKKQQIQRLKQIGKMKFSQYMNSKINHIHQEKDKKHRTVLNQIKQIMKLKRQFIKTEENNLFQFQESLLLKQKFRDTLSIRIKSYNNPK